MRLSRKLVPLTLAVITAAAVAAAPAGAADSVQVVNEATAQECSSIVSPHTSGGCVVHASGTVELEILVLMWEIERTCDVELDLRIDGNGTAAIDDVDFYSTEVNADSDCDSNLPVIPCEIPWEGSGEETASGVIHATVDVCLDPAETDICGSELEFDIIEQGEGGAETYVVDFNNSNVGVFCRVDGTLEVESTGEGNAAVHVNHL